MFDLGLGEIAVVALGALLLFGPSRLPELGRALGKSMKAFREGVQEARDALKEPGKG